VLGSILSHFPNSLKTLIGTLPSSVQALLEEIRIREDRPLELIYDGKHRFLSVDGTLAMDPRKAYLPTRADCGSLLEFLTHHSLYSFEEELRRGYITIQGGHRVGLSGRTVLEDGKVKSIRDVSSFNVRIAREVRGAAQRVLPYLIKEDGRVASTLIVSPPQAGKTTLLRDIIRLLSSGEGTERRKLGQLPASWKIGVVDERSEIAACMHGVPRFDLGPRTDVLDACPKAEGMMMMIRSMSPEVIAVDEIGRVEDAAAIREALHAGIAVIATAHGADLEDVRSRPVLQSMMEGSLFDRYVILSPRRDNVSSFQIYSGSGHQPWTEIHTAKRG
jgi:stage III sporulation protein AA